MTVNNTRAKGETMATKLAGMEWVKAEIAKLVAKHPAAAVDVRAGCAYVTIGSTVHYLDDSTGERIRDTWKRDN